MSWLGMALTRRGAVVTNDGGLPNESTLKLGLKHLDDYIVKKRNFYMPKVVGNDYQNYMMLGYYRNPLNFVFFNEALIVCSVFSFGNDAAWKDGVSVDEIFKKTCYLSELLKREEVIKNRFTPTNRTYFDQVVEFMESQRLVTTKDGNLTLKSTGEGLLLMMGSIVWPMIDTYYVVLLYTMTLVKQKNILDANFPKDVQWMAETLFIEGKL